MASPSMRQRIDILSHADLLQKLILLVFFVTIAVPLVQIGGSLLIESLPRISSGDVP